MSLPPELAAAVADALGRPVGSATRLGGGDINEAWQVATSEWPVFVKAHRTAGLAAFEDEAWGLRWLAEPGSVAVPEVLGVGQVGDGPWAFLALAWVEPGRPSDHHDERLGRGLAELHAAGAPSFGLDRPGTLGSLRLDNTPGPTGSATASSSWPARPSRRRDCTATCGPAMRWWAPTAWPCSSTRRPTAATARSTWP